MNRPVPDVESDDYRPFWDAARDHRIVIHRCATCRTFRWPPRPICRVCHSLDFEWAEVARRGTLHTWTVVVHQTVAGLPPPYVVGLVELEDVYRVRLLGNVVGVPSKNLRIGMPMQTVFEAVTPTVTLINWGPIERD